MIVKSSNKWTHKSQPRCSAVARAVKFHSHARRGHLLAAAVVSSALAMPQEAPAQQQGRVLEEIVVTATKRAESLQDIPISVTALGADRIEELGIADFESYAQMLPNLSYKSVGPGTATLIMRGAADGGDGNASGSQPSVGLYLDESPVTTIASNLDIHIYDIERIEALGGPQGTLFGASSQSGNLRIITNKPDPEQFSGGVDVGGFGMSDGEPSYSVEGFVNAPISDTAAIRLVGWYLDEGGYIDNVPGSRTYLLEGGYGYNPNNFGRSTTIDNSSLVQEDFNELTKIGARAALRVDLNDNWTADASVIYQNLETDGTWDHDPAGVGERSIQRYFPDFSDDEFTQGNITLEGEIGDNQLIYSGTFMDRDVQYQADYSEYGDYAYGDGAYWVPYYVCDYSATGPDIATQSATDCTSLEEYYQEDNQYERTTHELRLQSIGDGALQYTVGLYSTEITHDYNQEWIQPGIAPSQAVPGQAPNTFFRTRQSRTDEQTAVFTEMTYDLTDSVSLTGGLRWFQNDSKLSGVVGWGPNLFGDADTSVDASYDDDDFIYKANLTWRLDDDRMVYVTVSEGYRPGGLNRDPGLAAVGASEYKPDVLTNYEFGWKLMLAGGRVRLNGAIYQSDWEDVQFTIYDFALSACCGSVYNLADAEITGFEADITALVSDQLTLSAALSFNDGETSSDYVLPAGRGTPVPKGTELPNVPEWKGNVSARYEFEWSTFDAYWQAAWMYTGESFNEIRPDQRSAQDSYNILNLRAGISKDDWGIDAYINNATDEAANIYVAPRPYEPSITTNRPLSYGLKYWKRF
ncbi:MAG: TonB-dependent receptor [Gammaproteobacteria bacterium]|nr:TonB-dependent receptor [Gammaproteobacteria bacterium]